MPFKKTKGGYKSPSGHMMTKKQVSAYHAKKDKPKKKTKKTMRSAY